MFFREDVTNMGLEMAKRIFILFDKEYATQWDYGWKLKRIKPKSSSQIQNFEQYTQGSFYINMISENMKWAF